MPQRVDIFSPLCYSSEISEVVRGELRIDAGKHKTTRSNFLLQVLKNFWNAVEKVNPDAAAEPFTNVLWGSIGVNACHAALVPVINHILNSTEPALTQERFAGMLRNSLVRDYAFWFTRPGEADEDGEEGEYPESKGEATKAIGASGYSRLGKQLEREWRKTFHRVARASA